MELWLNPGVGQPTGSSNLPPSSMDTSLKICSKCGTTKPLDDSSSQPSGQRVEDKVQWCVEMLKLYAPEMLGSDPVG